MAAGVGVAVDQRQTHATRKVEQVEVQQEAMAHVHAEQLQAKVVTRMAKARVQNLEAKMLHKLSLAKAVALGMFAMPQVGKMAFKIYGLLCESYSGFYVVKVGEATDGMAAKMVALIVVAGEAAGTLPKMSYHLRVLREAELKVAQQKRAGDRETMAAWSLPCTTPRYSYFCVG